MSRTVTCVIVTCRGYERRTLDSAVFTRETKTYTPNLLDRLKGACARKA